MQQPVKKYLYGDYGDKENAGSNDDRPSKKIAANEWPLGEVFIRSKQGLDHKHAGSLHAADATMAMENARDVYTRRQEGISIWVVEAVHIHASNPADSDSLFDPANDKLYRHPTFYELPDELKHM
jgi:ring-1,2-phenylacetyl-CoA epoxidase subunit PaaB